MKMTVIGLLQTLPPIFLGPLIGGTVDRVSKRAILIGSNVAGALLIGVIPCSVSAQTFTVESLYLLVFLSSVATAMFEPTLSASVPFLVNRPQFTAANALLQSTTSIGIIIGPALSGLGIALAGSKEVLCVNALTYWASAACLLPIHLPRRMITKPGNNPLAIAVRDLIEGMRYALISHRTILILILLASMYTFGAGAFTTLFPVFGKKLLTLGPVQVGYL